jgi:molybdopterin-guanine dinucleotide biosynthesis protein A
MHPLHAVILGGGAGSRLGGISKWRLRVGGQTMLDRVSQRLDGIPGPILFSCGPAAGHLDYPSDYQMIADLDAQHRGPLAGLAAAVAWLTEAGFVNGALVSVAVDTPFLPEDYVSRLLAALPAAPAAYASWGDTFYPTNAAWRLDRLANLPGLMAAADGPSSPKALQRLLGAVPVDWSGDLAENPFVNANTLSDLIALQKRALG